MEFLIAVITGATGAAAIKLIDNIIQHKLQRRAKKEDQEDEKLKAREEEMQAWKENIEKRIDDLIAANRIILFDRIRWFGQKHIDEEEIDIDDLRLLNNMHDVYHENLDGNGGLSAIMKTVNSLPLKHRRQGGEEHEKG